MSSLYLDKDDVVSVGQADYSPTNAPTTTVGEMKSSLLKTWFAGYLSGWIAGGMACRVLSAQGGGWQTGKILFRLEFIPDRPKIPEQKPSTSVVSPLADLRSQLDTQ